MAANRRRLTTKVQLHTDRDTLGKALHALTEPSRRFQGEASLEVLL